MHGIVDRLLVTSTHSKGKVKQKYRFEAPNKRPPVIHPALNTTFKNATGCRFRAQVEFLSFRPFVIDARYGAFFKFLVAPLVCSLGTQDWQL